MDAVDAENEGQVGGDGGYVSYSGFARLENVIRTFH